MWLKYSDTELLNTDKIQGIIMCNFGSNGASIKADIDKEHSIILFSDTTEKNCQEVFDAIVKGIKNNVSLLEISGQHTRRVGGQ